MIQIPDVRRLVVFIAAYFTAIELGHLVTVSAGGAELATIWPPSGLLVGVLVLSRRRHWTAWLVTAFIAQVVFDVGLHRSGWTAAFGLALATCVEAVIATSLLEAWLDFPFRDARVKDVVALTASAMIAGIVGGTVAAATARVPGVPIWPVWPTSWLSDAMGIMLVAPLLFAWRAERANLRALVRSWRIVELLIACLGVIVIAHGVWGEGFIPALRIPALMLPYLLWSAYRFELTGAAVVLPIAAGIGMWNTVHGHGPYFGIAHSTFEWVLRSQGTLAVADSCLLLVGSALAERRRVAREHTTLVAELQQALAEIKTLQGMIPICAWCHKIRDDAGFWQQIEIYLQVHTQATFSHGICPECSKEWASRPRPVPAEHASPDERPSP